MQRQLKRNAAPSNVVRLIPEGDGRHRAVPADLDNLAPSLLVLAGDSLDADILKDCLESAGYHDVSVSTSLAAAHAQITETAPALVVFDDAGDGSAGLDLYDELRAHQATRSTSLIVLANTVSRRSRLRALESGLDDLLAKPVDATELALRIRRALTVRADRERLAFSDRVTGLSNRDRFFDQLDWALKYARRHGTSGAVLYIGLDRFGQVNDALGAVAGDRVLREIGRRLADCLRDTDFVVGPDEAGSTHLVSRLGGDEFAVMLLGLARPDSAALVAKRIQEAVEVPIDSVERQVSLSCSVGISVFPNDGESRDAILRAAGAALRHAKHTGRGNRQFYSRELNGRALHRLSLESELRRALEQGDLRLHYQPKVDVASGRVVGAEALARWPHPTRGMIPPGDFIPIAEDTGLILPLGEWVIDEACRQMREWHRQGVAMRRIAVNVSVHQFRRGNVAELVRKALERSSVSAACLGLEFTESAVMENAADNLRVLQDLKAIGVELAVDDFGTGYSSLSYLRRFPLDELKVDRAFLNDVEGDGNGASIVAAIIALGHRLGLRVVAEGVETDRQLDFLRAQRCDEFQGFLFSRPVPAEDLSTLIAPR